MNCEKDGVRRIVVIRVKAGLAHENGKFDRQTNKDANQCLRLKNQKEHLFSKTFKQDDALASPGRSKWERKDFLSVMFT